MRFFGDVRLTAKSVAIVVLAFVIVGLSMLTEWLWNGLTRNE